MVKKEGNQTREPNKGTIPIATDGCCTRESSVAEGIRKERSFPEKDQGNP